VMSRHRGAKQLRQYELSRVISLLSLAYLLFVERYLFHTKISGHYGRQLIVPGKHVCFSVKRVFTITLYKFITISQNSLLRASVTLWEATAPVKLPLIQKLPNIVSTNKIFEMIFQLLFNYQLPLIILK